MAISANKEGNIHSGVLIYPLFIIIIGIGISYSISLPKRILFKKLLIGLVLTIYSVLLINFLVIYFLRYPIYNSEGPNFSTRILSRYIVLANAQDKFVYIHSPEPDALYRGYVLYANTFNKNSAKTVSKNLNNNTYTLNNARFLKGCPNKDEIGSSKNIIIVNNVLRCEIKI